jgi:hypothetical protein
MAASKPQIRSLFATPVCIHFHPVAQEINAELKPLILARADGNAGNWRSDKDFESWSGVQGQTLFRMLRDLADGLTQPRSGGRTSVEWKVSAAASVRGKGEYVEMSARPGWLWSGVYYIDDGYHKADDESLGGACELADPRGVLPAMIAPQFAYRMPDGLTAGGREIVRPQSGMIILHPSWLPRGESRFEGADKRITVEFDMMVP